MYSTKDLIFWMFACQSYVRITQAARCLTCQHPDIRNNGNPQCKTPIRVTDFGPSVKVSDLIDGRTLAYNECNEGCSRMVFSVNEEQFVSFGCDREFQDRSNYWERRNDDGPHMLSLDMTNCRRNEPLQLSGKKELWRIVECFRCSTDTCTSPEVNPLRMADWYKLLVKSNGSSLVNGRRTVVQPVNLGFAVGNLTLELMMPDPERQMDAVDDISLD